MIGFLRLSAFVLIFAFVAGCASTSGHSGRSGTQKPYKIAGRWYTPRESAYRFEESGIASWYGRPFHGRKTANGETYNMYGMTAAHKTLPMGTYVRVENEESGKSAIVRINDRGPFVSGRIIDLSYKAAGMLGVRANGTAEVTIAALGSVSGDRLVKKDYSKGDFVLQVGSFKLKVNAIRLKKNLKSYYKKVYISRFYLDGSAYYRVRVGNYKSLAAVKRARKAFSFPGTGSPFIVAK